MPMTSNYDDIINLPHHVSEERSRMSRRDRAAQFAPFAALTGYDDEVKETARLTDERLEIDEYRAEHLDCCLRILTEHADERPEISVTFFTSDEKKSGGAYLTVNGAFRRLDESDCTVVMTDGRKIPVYDIFAIEGEILAHLDNFYEIE